MTEAEKPRPLREHLNRATEIYNKLCGFARDTDGLVLAGSKAVRDQQLATLRESASKGFWLYPLIEARHGAPR
jgi:hypothetical protein